MIRKEHGMYVMRTRQGGRILGKHKYRIGAERQERAINISKARAHGHIIPYRHAKLHPYAARHRHTHHMHSR
jgi:hypothetical protein